MASSTSRRERRAQRETPTAKRPLATIIFVYVCIGILALSLLSLLFVSNYPAQ